MLIPIGFFGTRRNPVTIMDGSYQNTSLTGGWTFDYGPGNPTPASGSITSVGLQITAPWWGGGSFTTVNNISLVGATSITVQMNWTNNVNYTSSPWTNSSVSFPLSNGTGSLTFQTPGQGSQNGSSDSTYLLNGNGGVGKITFSAGNTGSGGYVNVTRIVINY